MKLSKEEKATIAKLKRLEKTWPKTLWIFSASGILNIMKVGDNGEHIYTSQGGVDPEYVVGEVNVPSDGGDW